MFARCPSWFRNSSVFCLLVNISVHLFVEWTWNLSNIYLRLNLKCHIGWDRITAHLILQVFGWIFIVSAPRNSVRPVAFRRNDLWEASTKTSFQSYQKFFQFPIHLLVITRRDWVLMIDNASMGRLSYSWQDNEDTRWIGPARLGSVRFGSVEFRIDVLILIGLILLQIFISALVRVECSLSAGAPRLYIIRD